MAFSDLCQSAVFRWCLKLLLLHLLVLKFIWRKWEYFSTHKQQIMYFSTFLHLSLVGHITYNSGMTARSFLFCSIFLVTSSTIYGIHLNLRCLSRYASVLILRCLCLLRFDRIFWRGRNNLLAGRKPLAPMSVFHWLIVEIIKEHLWHLFDIILDCRLSSRPMRQNFKHPLVDHSNSCTNHSIYEWYSGLM